MSTYSRSNARQVSIPLLLTWLALCIYSGVPQAHAKAAVLQAGVLDLRAHDFTQAGSVTLSGEWQFFPGQLLSAIPADTKGSLVPVPDVWHNNLVTERGPGFGAGTYALKVLLPPGGEEMGISIRTISSAYRVIANGVPIASSGQVGLDAGSFEPGYRPQVVRLPAEVEQLELLVQVSNFVHTRGGFWDFTLLGTHDDLQGRFLRNLDLAMFLASAALLLGLYHLMLWVLRPQELTPLVFTLLSFSGAVRVICLNEVYLLQLFPGISYELQLRIEYTSMILLVGLSMVFVAAIFPREFDKRLLYLLLAPQVVYVAIVWLAPLAFYSGLLPYFHMLVLACIACNVYVMTMAVKHKRYGAVLYTASIGALALIILHDLLTTIFPLYAGLDALGGNEFLLPIGFIGALLAQALLLAQRTTAAISELEERTVELSAAHQSLDHHAQQLELRVAERTAELEAANAQLDELARIDGLTQLPNRRYFDEKLEETWSDHARSGQALSLVLIDVDKFKQYNDHYGHVQGDEALQQVARALQAAVHRPTDFVARYGGEEMVALLPNTGKDGALAIAEAMRVQVERLAIPHEVKQRGRLTISLGVMSGIPRQELDGEALLQCADAALYRAKSEGRNRVCAADWNCWPDG